MIKQEKLNPFYKYSLKEVTRCARLVYINLFDFPTLQLLWLPGPPWRAAGPERADCALLGGVNGCSLWHQRGESQRALGLRQSQDGRSEEESTPATPGHQDAGFLER